MAFEPEDVRVAVWIAGQPVEIRNLPDVRDHDTARDLADRYGGRSVRARGHMIRLTYEGAFLLALLSLAMTRPAATFGQVLQIAAVTEWDCIDAGLRVMELSGYFDEGDAHARLQS